MDSIKKEFRHKIVQLKSPLKALRMMSQRLLGIRRHHDKVIKLLHKPLLLTGETETFEDIQDKPPGNEQEDRDPEPNNDEIKNQKVKDFMRD